VHSVRVHLPTERKVVILEERGADRYLPIWTGEFEANAIVLAIQGQTPERVVTHDLIAAILNVSGGKVDRAEITELRNDVFFARLIGRIDSQSFDVGAKSADTIAVALRVAAPVFVAAPVLEKAGVFPEPQKAGSRFDLWRTLKRSLRRAPAQASPLSGLGSFQARQDGPEWSLDTTTVVQGPNSASALMRRGAEHRHQGRFEEALADLNRALELEPNSDSRASWSKPSWTSIGPSNSSPIVSSPYGTEARSTGCRVGSRRLSWISTGPSSSNPTSPPLW
jgi:bifunctional DNase/RNase